MLNESIFDKLSVYPPMSTDNQPKALLAKALVKAIAETSDVVADSKNPYHDSKYASLSAHLAKLKPIFAKHGLAIIQFPSGGFDGGVGVRTVVMHESGEYIESVIAIDPPYEKGVDKNGNAYERKGYNGQQAGAVISYLRRYALASVAGVATDDDDANSAMPSGSLPVKAVTKSNYIPNPNASATAPAPAPAPAAPVAGDIDPSIVVPFGNNKGQAIGTLSKRDLEFWATKWEPRPYEKTGKVTKKDAMLKATAVHLFNATSAPADVDDVPFGDENEPF